MLEYCKSYHPSGSPGVDRDRNTAGEIGALAGVSVQESSVLALVAGMLQSTGRRVSLSGIAAARLLASSTRCQLGVVVDAMYSTLVYASLCAFGRRPPNFRLLRPPQRQRFDLAICSFGAPAASGIRTRSPRANVTQMCAGGGCHGVSISGRWLWAVMGMDDYGRVSAAAFSTSLLGRQRHRPVPMCVPAVDFLRRLRRDDVEREDMLKRGDWAMTCRVAPPAPPHQPWSGRGAVLCRVVR